LKRKNRECAACLKYSVRIFLNKYIKCNVCRLAVRYDINICVIRRLKFKLHIYLRTNETLIRIPYMYLTTGGKIESIKRQFEIRICLTVGLCTVASYVRANPFPAPSTYSSASLIVNSCTDMVKWVKWLHVYIHLTGWIL
jgi:hypothetical protein